MTTQANITHVVMHYSATYADQDIGAAEIDRWHRDRGFARIGYHWVIRRDGTVEKGRPENVVGAHVKGHNSRTIGVCVVGGLERALGGNKGVDNRTPAQINAQIKLTREILARHPGAKVVGHRDLGPTQCPAYDAAAWWAQVSRQTEKASPPPSAPLPGEISTQKPGLLASLLAALAAFFNRSK